MNDLIRKISTIKEKDKVLTFLDSFEFAAFNPNMNLSDFINQNAPDFIEDEVLSYFKNELLLGQSEQVLQKIKELRKDLGSLSKVTLTIAQDPSEQTINVVKQHITNEDKPVLIEFVKDPTIIGGAVIESNGSIFEHSFRDYFEKRREAKNGV